MVINVNKFLYALYIFNIIIPYLKKKIKKLVKGLFWCFNIVLLTDLGIALYSTGIVYYFDKH